MDNQGNTPTADAPPPWLTALLGAITNQQNAVFGNVLQQIQAQSQQAQANLVAAIASAPPNVIQTQAPVANPPRPPSIKFESPKKFNGKATDVPRFVSQVREAILLQRDAFANDTERSTYMATLLEDLPRAWLTGITTTNPLVLANFNAFVDLFVAHFGDPDLAGTTLRKIQNLKQSGSVVDFAAKFNELLALVNMTEETKMDLFYCNLKDSVQSAMVAITRPTTLAALQTKAIEIDNNLYKLRQLQKGRHQANASASNPATPTLANSDAMDLSAASVGKPHGPLSPEEKQRRKDNNLCYYCAGAGHIGRDCVIRPKKTSGKA